MKKNIHLVFALCMVIQLFFIPSCKKDEPDDSAPAPVAGSNNVSFEITNKVGASVLDLISGSYTNAAGNSFTVSKFKYYISNLSFTKKDGGIYVVPTDKNSNKNYFLVDESVPVSKNLVITDVPAGDYTAVSFMIGIDSLRNVSGAQSGALDPINDMFWSWNQGYIFLKMEGNSPQATGGGNLMFHIAGFTAPDNTLRTVTLSLAAENITVRKNIAPEIHLSADLAKMFESPSLIDFSFLSSSTIGGHNATALAENYKNMFLVDHVHNEPQ